MNLTEIINYILIPLGVSFISAFLIWCFSQLYTIGARTKINHLLIIMRDECIAFEKYLNYNDYDNALQMSRRIIDKTYEVFITKKPFTYLSVSKHLLINTLLNNIYYACHRFTQQEIGYSDENEKIACCEKMKKYIFSIGWSQQAKASNPAYLEPLTSVSTKVLIDLNLHRTKPLRKILRDGFFFNGYPTECGLLKIYFKDLIQIDLFKNHMSPSVGKVFYLTNSTITQKEYEKIINKIKD